jgi:hypothetical protein
MNKKYLVLCNDKDYNYYKARDLNKIYWHDYCNKGYILKPGDYITVCNGSLALDIWKIKSSREFNSIEEANEDKEVYSKFWNDFKVFKKYYNSCKGRFLLLEKIHKHEEFPDKEFSCSKVNFENHSIKIDNNHFFEI